MRRIEFTIEPFIEGQPGRHVTAPLDVLDAMGITTEIGPFGSSCRVSADRVGATVSAIVDTALAHGATHVNIDVTQDDEA